MKKMLKYIKIFGFILLMLLALMGVGLPIPMYQEDKFKQKKEWVMKEEESIKS